MPGSAPAPKPRKAKAAVSRTPPGTASPPPEPEPGLSEADQQHHQDTRLPGRVFWRDCSGDAFVKLVRCENTTRHAFYKALHELKLVQSRRQAQPARQDQN